MRCVESIKQEPISPHRDPNLVKPPDVFAFVLRVVSNASDTRPVALAALESKWRLITEMSGLWVLIVAKHPLVAHVFRVSTTYFLRYL